MTSDGEASKIIAIAQRSNIDLLDTSSAYGESEKRIGDLLDTDHGFSIVTKTPEFKSKEIGPEHEAELRAAFARSLERLKQKRVYGFLLHHADDLLAPGGERLMAAMSEFQSQGLVQKLGVSIYRQSQLTQVLSRFAVDIVQIPLSVLDQRLLRSGAIDMLNRSHIEIHARSAFLQGALLMKPDEIPSHLAAIRPQVSDFHRSCERGGISPIAAALAFMRGVPVDRVVVGVTSSAEFTEIMSAWSQDGKLNGGYERFAVDDEDLVDPSRWSRQ